MSELTCETDMKLRTATRRIAPADGFLVDLHGVREIAWDDVTGLRIVFAPGGGPLVTRAENWLPTRPLPDGTP